MNDKGEDRPIVIRNNEARQQFEAAVEGGPAILTYRKRHGEIAFLHTDVPPALEGHGIGGALARAGLDYARDQGLVVVPICPFVRAYIREHPEYASLVSRWPTEA
jgi:predicted GNAT family acetyltransferase